MRGLWCGGDEEADHHNRPWASECERLIKAGLRHSVPSCECLRRHAAVIGHIVAYPAVFDLNPIALRRVNTPR